MSAEEKDFFGPLSTLATNVGGRLIQRRGRPIVASAARSPPPTVVTGQPPNAGGHIDRPHKTVGSNLRRRETPTQRR